jgi:hypothetical protein
MDALIVYRNGSLVSVCSPAEIIIFNGTDGQAADALIEKGYADPSVILEQPPVDAAIFWPTILSAFNADRQAAIAENSELRGMVDALSAYVGDLASEIELRASKQILQKRIQQLESKINANIDTYRAWLQANTIVIFDISNDELVRQVMLRDTPVGREIKYLREVLNG